MGKNISAPLILLGALALALLASLIFFLPGEPRGERPCALGACPLELHEPDAGKTFTYFPATRFTVFLNETRNPQAKLRCEPAGVIGAVSNVPEAPPALYAASFETLGEGTCFLTNERFLATIVVASAAEEDLGALEGVMTLGPVCPVEREGEACLPTAEMFAARKVFIYLADRSFLVGALTPDGAGRFSAMLPAGEYYVAMEKPRIGAIEGVPATVRIEAGQTTRLFINVDTGIR